MPRLSLCLRTVLALAVWLACAPAARADARTHIVERGETLFRIALNYGVSVDALRAANGISGNTIYAGQTLVIPDPNTPAAPAAVASTASGGVYTVQRGDTLYRIGLKFGLAWTTIAQANGISGQSIYAGQRLVIPGQGGSAALAPAPAPQPEAASQPQAAPAPASDGAAYIVKRGDTLFTIGLKYGLQWTVIAQANGISGQKIYAGQRLVIPASGSATSGASGASSAAAPAAPPGEGKRFVVDLSEQRLFAYEGDTLVHSTLISSGVAKYPTVTGTFKIYLRYTSARMRGPGYDLPNVPYVMYFYKSYGLHGTYWHNNFGTPMSHGCVNMPTADAEWAYYWSDYGTPVIVQY